MYKLDSLKNPPKNAVPSFVAIYDIPFLEMCALDFVMLI